MAVARFDMGLTGDDDRKALKKYVLEIDQTVKRTHSLGLWKRGLWRLLQADHASTDGTVRRSHPTGAAHEQAQFNSDGAGVELMENATINPLSNWVRIEGEEHGRSHFFNTLTREYSTTSLWDPRVSDGQQLPPREARERRLQEKEKRLQEKERWLQEKERRLQEKEKAPHVHARPAIATERPQFQNKDTGALVAALPSVESWAAQHLPPALTVATTGNNVSSEECVGRLFQAIDADGNGSISLQEIMSWWSQQVQDGVASQASWQRLVSQFGTNPCSRQADSK